MKTNHLQAGNDSNKKPGKAKLTRRGFLALLGASSAAAGLAACSQRTPVAHGPAPIAGDKTAYPGIETGIPVSNAAVPGTPVILSSDPNLTTQGYSIFNETMVDMPWPAVEQAAKDGAIILMQTGVIEEHGPHMGLGVDTYLGYVVCKLIRRNLQAMGVQALITPPCYWGISKGTAAFPGTFTLRKETMQALLVDIYTNLRDWGFKKVFTLNYHGDLQHNLTILAAVLQAYSSLGLSIRWVLNSNDLGRYGLTGQEPYVLTPKSSSITISTPSPDVHAGSIETSLMARYFPEQVNLELARTLQPTNLDSTLLSAWANGSNSRDITPQGYVGDPSRVDLDLALKYTEETARLTAQAIAGVL